MNRFEELENELKSLAEDLVLSLDNFLGLGIKKETKKTALKKEIFGSADNMYKQLSLF